MYLNQIKTIRATIVFALLTFVFQANVFAEEVAPLTYKVSIPKELSRNNIYNGMPYNMALEALKKNDWQIEKKEELNYSESEFPEIGCGVTDATLPDETHCLIIVSKKEKKFDIFLKKGNNNYYIEGLREPVTHANR